jgi:phosphoribosylamine--glycine ligase
MNQSPRLTKLYVAPGNAGTGAMAENVAIGVTDFEALVGFIEKQEIDLLVVGPEDPLVEGIRDYLEADTRFTQLMIVGPGKAGAMLEGSKDFAKEFMSRHAIPTAKYLTVTPKNLSEGVAFLRQLSPPYVLKADGLAAGKGVLIVDSLEEGIHELTLMLEGKFGKAGNRVVIEEFLTGIELSVFVLTDGKEYKILGSAKDYKRIGAGDTGLNTGGMGAVSPVPFADEAFNRKVEELVIRPTVEGLQKEGIDYKGFIFFGLMKVGNDPYLIEYNVRMGDPETEVIAPRIKTDLLSLFEAMAGGTLQQVSFEWESRFCTTVMLVAQGYPGSYEKGKPITGFPEVEGSMVFHAGTTYAGGEIVTNGGRVIAISSYGETLNQALACSYANVEKIRFEGKTFRRDIGADLL